MKFYEKKNNKIICLLCAHYCQLKEGQSGICGVNENQNAKLVTKVYGYPIALQIDPIEKKPLYHFLAHTNTLSFGSVGCNFKCPFCQNWQISQTSSFSKKKYFTAEAIVDLACIHKCPSISYTYNEPTIFYPFLRDVAKKAKEIGIKNIMVSNGFMSEVVAKDMVGLIDAINIDIKSFDKDYYKKSLKADLDVVLKNAIFLKKANLHVEITTLLIPSIDEAQIKQIAKFIAYELGVDTPWHLSAYHPDYKMLNTQRTPLENLKKAYNIAKNYGINNVYLGNV